MANGINIRISIEIYVGRQGVEFWAVDVTAGWSLAGRGATLDEAMEAARANPMKRGCTLVLERGLPNIRFQAGGSWATGLHRGDETFRMMADHLANVGIPPLQALQVVQAAKTVWPAA